MGFFSKLKKKKGAAEQPAQDQPALKPEASDAPPRVEVRPNSGGAERLAPLRPATRQPGLGHT